MFTKDSLFHVVCLNGCLYDMQVLHCCIFLLSFKSDKKAANEDSESIGTCLPDILYMQYGISV